MSESRSRYRVARTETPLHPGFLVGRIYFAATLLLAEYALLVSIPHPWSHLHRLVAFCLVFGAVYLFLIPRRLQGYASPLPLSYAPLAVHAACIVLVAFCHHQLLKQAAAPSPLLLCGWYAGILVAAITLLFASLPIAAIRHTLHRTWSALAYAASAATIAALISGTVLNSWRAPTNFLTRSLQHATLFFVSSTLRWFYPGTQADPATAIVTLPHFAVLVGDTCSGIEGLSLTLLFCLGWFWYARRELRFPRAFLILPLALSLSFVFNILRLDVLLAIGNAGHPDLAIQSFHSEAGWIAFNFIALAFLAITSRLRFFLRAEPPAAAALSRETQPDAVSLYLLPFLAILGVGFLTRAFSPSGVEWLYPLRLLACTAVFLLYRNSYQNARWDFGWLGPLAGILVFAFWVPAADRLLPRASPAIVQTLYTAPAAGRWLWIVLRVLGSAVLIPIAEELAFRGFLLRRLTAKDFRSVRYAQTSWLALLLSSIVFGAMHGKLWLPGTLAGLAFGFVAKRTGRLTPAIVAHATTNLLLSLWVLYTHDWVLW